MVLGFAMTTFAATKTTNTTKTTNNTNSKKSTEDEASDKEIISYVKSLLNNGKFETEKDIESAVKKVINKYDISMTEKEIDKVVSLMYSLKSMGVEPKDISEQLDKLYEKYKPMIDNGTFSLEDITINDLGLDKVIKKGVNTLGKKITNGVKDFFTGIFR